MSICLLLRTSEITDFHETWYIQHATTNRTNFIFSKCIPWIIPTRHHISIAYWNCMWQETFKKYVSFAKAIFVCNVSNILAFSKLYTGFDFMEITHEEFELGFFFLISVWRYTGLASWPLCNMESCLGQHNSGEKAGWSEALWWLSFKRPTTNCHCYYYICCWLYTRYLRWYTWYIPHF